MNKNYSRIILGWLLSGIIACVAETRCEEVANPEIYIGIEQPDESVVITEDTYRIWADSNVENNARAYCFQSRFLLERIRMESYTIRCVGEPNTLYADHREDYAAEALGSFEGRLSGSSECYNLFTMIECCWQLYNNICFPPDAAVNVQGKGNTAMNDLRVGDNVQVSSDGSFEPIYSIAHQSHDPSSFLKIQTTNGALEISENHMLFIEGSSKPVVAKEVNLGDSLVGDAGPSEVKNIQKVKRHGLYAPLTYSGRIVVDGFEASVYARLFGETTWERMGLPLNLQGWYTLLQSPHRMLCKLNFDICRKETHDDQGLSYMLSFNEKLYGWWMKQSLLVCLLTIPLICIVFGCLFALEVAFFDRPAASLTLALVVLIWKRFNAVEIRAVGSKTRA